MAGSDGEYDAYTGSMRLVKKYPAFLIPQAIGAVPSALVILYLYVRRAEVVQMLLLKDVSLLPELCAFTLFAFILQLFVGTVTTGWSLYFVRESFSRRPRLSSSLASLWPHFWRFLATKLLVWLISIAIIAVFASLIGVTYVFQLWPALGVFAVILLVALIAMTVVNSFLPPVCLVEKKFYLGSLGRCVEIILSYPSDVFFTVIICAGFTFVFTLIAFGLSVIPTAGFLASQALNVLLAAIILVIWFLFYFQKATCTEAPRASPHEGKKGKKGRRD